LIGPVASAANTFTDPPTIEGKMDNLMYSDGKDEYVKIQIKDNDETTVFEYTVSEKE